MDCAKELAGHLALCSVRLLKWRSGGASPGRCAFYGLIRGCWQVTLAVTAAETICLTLAKTALDNDLPIDFFTRLIWQESHFRSNAISYAGAQGIAQFMPATAVGRGLADPFDPLMALQAAGRFLKQLRIQFGNLGLAAAAYNAGPGRVEAWLRRRAQLPRETRIYVWAITKIPAEQWIGLQDLPEHRMGSTVSCDAIAKLLLPRARKRQERPVQSQGR